MMLLEIYEKERIVIRQIGQYPIVGYCNERILTSNTIYNLLNNQFSTPDSDPGGLAIALLSMLVIVQVSSTNEAQRRVSTGGMDSTVNGQLALFELQRHIKRIKKNELNAILV